MKRTSIMLDEDLFLALRQIARREGKTFTDAVRESVAEYVAEHRRPQGLLSIAGIGHSGGPAAGDVRGLADRLDEILKSEIDPRQGWSPGRSPKSESQEPDRP